LIGYDIQDAKRSNEIQGDEAYNVYEAQQHDDNVEAEPLPVSQE
jgi:hypothetical protein